MSLYVGRSKRDQQMSGSANVQVESANVRLAEISKCLSQQMSRPSQQMSNQQMSVSKCPVSRWKISKVPDTRLAGLARIDDEADEASLQSNQRRLKLSHSSVALQRSRPLHLGHGSIA